MLPVIGPLIFLAIVLPWPLFIAQKMNWDLTVWKHEFVDRLFGQYRTGHKPNYYYLYIMFQFIIPWVAFLPMALAAPFFKVWDKKRPLMFFLWIWFVAGLLFLTIDRGKRQHYILPLMPAMAILVGILLEDMFFTRKAYTAKFAADILRYHCIVIIVAIIAGTIYMARTYRSMLGDVLILDLIAVVSIAAVAVLFAKNKQALACGMVFAGIRIIINVSYITIFNPLDCDRHSREFSKKVAAMVPPSDRLIAYKNVSNRFVQYFGKVLPEITDDSALLQDYRNGNWVVATGDGLQKLQESGQFTQVYYQQKAERSGQDDVPGALFHKGNPILQGAAPDFQK